MALEKDFLGRYLNKSTRSSTWDYSGNGFYFLTLNVYKREHLFGEIRNGLVILSEFGKIVEDEWKNSFQIRKELTCEIYVIMPDHLHAIVEIDGAPRNYSENPNIKTEIVNFGIASLKPEKLINPGIQNRTPKSISSFVAGFKSSVTSNINRLRNTPGQSVWQPRFYDRVIRNQEEYNEKFNYILKNPSRWEQKHQ